MDTAEADRLWNLPKCERCDAMESRLRAALTANDSFVRGVKLRESKIAELEQKLKKAELALLDALKGQRWMRA